MLHSNTSPRERRRLAKTAEILDAAKEIVVSVGFDGLSMSKLAAAVDLTPGALYRYFDGKDAIIAGLTTKVILDHGQAVQHALDATPDATPLQRIVFTCLAYRQLAETQPQRFGLISMLLAHPRDLVPDSDAARGAIGAMMGQMDGFVGAFAEAAASGDLHVGDPLERAVLAFATTHGVLQLRKQSRRMPALIDIDRLTVANLRALLAGWGASPEALEDAFATPVGGTT